MFWWHGWTVSFAWHGVMQNQFLTCLTPLSSLFKWNVNTYKYCQRFEWLFFKGWIKNVARTRSLHELRNVYKTLVAKPEGKCPCGRCRHRWKDYIKMDLREISFKNVSCIYQAQNRVHGVFFVLTRQWTFRFRKLRHSLSYMSDHQIFKKDCFKELWNYLCMSSCVPSSHDVRPRNAFNLCCKFLYTYSNRYMTCSWHWIVYLREGRTENYKKFLRTVQYMDKRLLLTHNLMRRLVDRAATCVPELIVDFTKYR